MNMIKFVKNWMKWGNHCPNHLNIVYTITSWYVNSNTNLSDVQTYKQMWYRPFTTSTETVQGTDCGGYAVPF